MALTKVPSNLDATVATTQSASDNSTNVATTAYVTTAIANLVDGAPSTLNTLDEIAAALNDDAALNTTLTNSIATKLPLAGGTMSGALNMGSQHITNVNRISTADGVLDTGQAGSTTVFNDSGSTADFRIESTSNTHMFFLDGGLNRIGINQSSPSHALHVVGGDNDEARVRVHNSASGQASLDLDNSEGYFRTFTDAGEYRIYDQTDGAYRLLIDTAGKVGIGTSSPSSLLHCVASGADAKIQVETDGGNDAILELTAPAASGAQSKLMFSDDGASGVGSIIYAHNSGGTDYMTFATASTERMRIDSSGNLSLGTSSHVNLSGSTVEFTIGTTGDTANDGGGISFAHNTSTLNGYLLGQKQSLSLATYSTTPLLFLTNNTERMRIGSGGKTSWSAGGIGNVATQTRDFTFYTEGGSNGVAIHSNDHRIVFMGGAASSGSGMDSGYLQLEDAGTAKIVLNSVGTSYFNGGNVGIGNTSPSYKLHVSGHTSSVSSVFEGNGGGDTVPLKLKVKANDNSTSLVGLEGEAGSDSSGNGLQIVATDYIRFNTGGSATERFRLEDNGVLLFHTTTQSGISNGTSNINCGSLGSGQLVLATNNDIPIIINRALGSGTMMAIRNNGSNVGSITQNGSSTSFNTSSDYRLKENVDYDWDATSKLKQLKPCEFKFKADNDDVVNQGFLAHEVDDIVPTSVFGEKDGEEMQQLDHSKLVPLLVKTIQELEARIATLEG